MSGNKRTNCKKTISNLSKSVELNIANNDTNNKTDISAECNTTDVERQFEVELCWCIQQLQNALNSGKLNKKQVQDHTKALNILLSLHSPLIKKRQVMRLSFGDYRTKMAAEEKKYKGNISTKILRAKPSDKSTFVRKSVVHSSDKNLKFNFNLEVENDSQVTPFSIEDNVYKQQDIIFPKSDFEKSFKFTPTDNSFKFSFTIEDSDKLSNS